MSFKDYPPRGLPVNFSWMYPIKDIQDAGYLA
jgi:hypothetical protein